jgi:hypothetical protein
MALEITGANQDVMVGELIKLGINFTKETWGNLETVKWTIPGRIVKDYKDGQREAHLTELQPAEFEQQNLSYYWVDEGEGRTVKADCVFRTMSGKEMKLTLNANFNVKRPECEFTARYGKVFIGNAYVPEPRFGLNYGTNEYNPGIEWKVKVTTPGIGAGWIKDVQVITSERVTVRDPGNERRVVSTRGKKELDTQNPYTPHVRHPEPPIARGIAESGYTGEIGGGATVGFESHDFPGNRLVDAVTEVTIDDEFELWVMYRPKKDGSIWVPLKRIKWRWGANATKQGGRWPGNPVIAKQGGDAAGADTTDFPLYLWNIWLTIRDIRPHDE